MIRLYVANEKFVKEEKDIWIALQKAEMESLNDCEISNVECDVEVQEFLCFLEISKANIFELNVFAGLLSALPVDGLMFYREKLKDKQSESLKEDIMRFDADRKRYRAFQQSHICLFISL